MILPARLGALGQATARLAEAGIDQPAREARLLLALALSVPDGALPPPEAAIPDLFWALLNRRVAREPMARLRGRQGFWTLDLALSPDTLIPRADSETVIEAALAARPDRSSVARILDLGTGSGALLLAALSEFPGAWGLGIDLSPGACAVAAGNAAANHLDERGHFVCGDWAACVRGTFDLIVCNPPYIARAEVAGLMPEVSRHEPHRALEAGDDGLAAFRRLIPALPALLAPDAVAILEHGEGQGEAVATILSAAGLWLTATRCDLGGIRRVAVAQKAVGDRPGSDYV